MNRQNESQLMQLGGQLRKHYEPLAESHDDMKEFMKRAREFTAADIDVAQSIELRRKHRCQSKSCFRNCQSIALDNPNYRYFEGRGYRASRFLSAFEHAWLVDAQGKVVDPTWIKTEVDVHDHLEYMGIEIPKQNIRRYMLQRKSWQFTVAKFLAEIQTGRPWANLRLIIGDGTVRNRDADVHHVHLITGITRTPAFEEKRLATHAVNVGLLCGHGCTYCSTPSLIRTHGAFKKIGKTAFTDGLVVVDPNTPDRVRRDAGKLTKTDRVQLSTITDPYSHEAQDHDIGRQCLEVLFEESDCQVRILTKNAAVRKDLDLIERHKERTLFGMSLTAAPSKAAAAQVCEPYASPIPDRIKVLKEAAERGIPTYGMICPCLPSILDSANDLREVAEVLSDIRPVEVFLEPVNARGRGLIRTCDALKQASFLEEAATVNAVRRDEAWSEYVVGLVKNATTVFEDMGWVDRLRILMYGSRLSPEDRGRLEKLPAIIWL